MTRKALALMPLFGILLIVSVYRTQITSVDLQSEENSQPNQLSLMDFSNPPSPAIQPISDPLAGVTKLILTYCTVQEQAQPGLNDQTFINAYDVALEALNDVVKWMLKAPQPNTTQGLVDF